MHPLHPMSVHLPVAFILITPLADLAAHLSQRADVWCLGAITTIGAVGFGLIAATLGALDFERAHAKAPRTVIAHASAMAIAVALTGATLIGRVDGQLAVAAPAPLWAIFASVFALCVMLAGAYLGGDLVYRHGVNVGVDDQRR